MSEIQRNEAQVVAMHRRLASSRHDHARGCHKPISDCRVCVSNIEWFGALPTWLLALVLEEV